MTQQCWFLEEGRYALQHYKRILSTVAEGIEAGNTCWQLARPRGAHHVGFEVNCWRVRTTGQSEVCHHPHACMTLLHWRNVDAAGKNATSNDKDACD
jgi:hypothetical protein